MMLGLLALLIGSLSYAKSLPHPSDKIKPISFVIQGIIGDPLKNIKARMEEKEKGLDGKYTKTNMRRFKHHLRAEVENAIKPFGYFQSRVHDSLFYRDGTWTVKINIIPGPQLKFTSLDLRITGPGASDPVYQKLYHHFPVKPGVPFNSKKYTTAKQDLFNIASNRGYFNAKLLKNQLIVDLNNYTAKVVLHFDTGPRFYFGKTTFSKTPFHLSFLKKFIEYKKGEHYKARKLNKSRKNFANSGYFQEVIAIPRIKHSKNLQTPVHFKLSPVAKKQYTFGLGYGTDTSFRGLIAMNYNWLNGYGHKFDAMVRGSQINNQIEGHYIIPGSHPGQDQYIFSAGYANEDFSTGKSNSIRAGFSYQTVFKNWQLVASLTYLDERSNYPTLPGSPTVNANLVYPNFTALRRVADDPLNPSKGYRLFMNFAGANHRVLSKISFVQGQLSLKALYTFFNHVRIIFRSNIGATDINEIQNLPLTLQFYAGGAESIRGYTYNQFGPGRYLFTGSFETQLRFYKDWYLVGFVDAGNAANSLKAKQMNVGVGPGIAWASPVGLLELTIANAITAPTQPWVIQFNMGPIL